MRKFGRLERKKAIATLVAVVSCAGLLASCSSADPWAEPVYLQNLYVFDGAAWNQITTNGGGGGLGDVVGPAASTDNAIARYNLLTGKLIQNSGVTIDDFDNLDTNGGDLTGFDIWADNDVNIVNDLDVDDDADIGGDLTITGTVDGVNVSAHAARHAVSGTDTVFPADPGADKYLMWDDVPGNLSWEDAGGSSVGGLYGINVETLAGNKTLTANTDYIYQYLNPNGSNRTITLAVSDAVAGDRFIIKNTANYNTSTYLKINQSPAVSLYEDVYNSSVKEYIFDGTNWVAADVGTGYANQTRWNIAIGNQAAVWSVATAIGTSARAYSSSVALGGSAQSGSDAVAVGNSSQSFNYSVAIGRDSESDKNCSALGYDADARSNNVYYSVALGYCSQPIRSSEVSINLNGDSSQKNNAIQVGFVKTTTNSTPIEMLCGGVAAQRCTIRPSSAMSFDIQVVARDNVANEVARYSFSGLIKRDGSNNTVLSWSTSSVDYEDDANWACTIAADDTNEALVITVTGDGTNPTQFAAVLDGCETHY